MSTKNGSAEIVELDNARELRRSGEIYRDAGAHLAAVRESMGLSIEEAAENTKIKVEHLTAIENIDRRALPTKPYALGFVKTYAEFLELNAASIVQRFRDDVGYGAAPIVEPKKVSLPEPTPEEESRELSLWALGRGSLFHDLVLLADYVHAWLR